LFLNQIVRLNGTEIEQIKEASTVFKDKEGKINLEQMLKEALAKETKNHPKSNDTDLSPSITNFNKTHQQDEYELKVDTKETIPDRLMNT
jgi:hypothetical protein